MYKNKYIKYKKKYLQLKNSIGGTYSLNLSEWKKIENLGQQNCGIFISDIYNDYIVKCVKSTNIELIKEYNNKTKTNIFPNIINVSTIDDNMYITMQKLDGDITSIFFNLFPKKVIANMIETKIITEEIGKTLFELFLGKCNYTMFNSKNLDINFENDLVYDSLLDNKIHESYIEYLTTNNNVIGSRTTFKLKNSSNKDIEYKDIYNESIDNILRNKEKLEKFKNFPDITLELYDLFIQNIINLWRENYEIITKEIIKLQLELIRNGYRYSDNKFDNFGYILSSEVLQGDFRNSDVPKIFDKYFYVYILDWDSGFYKLDDSTYQADQELYNRRIIESVNDGLQYSVNGQYKLNNINRSIVNRTYEERPFGPTLHADISPLGIKPELLKILNKDYKFDLHP